MTQPNKSGRAGRPTRENPWRPPGANAVAAIAGSCVFLALLVAVVTGLLGPGSADAQVERSAHTAILAAPTGLALARFLTNLGAPLVVDIVAAVAAVVSWTLGHKRAALYIIAVRLAAQIVESVAKRLVGRARPTFAHPVAHATGYSFPSGHATGAASVYLPLAVVAGTLVASRALRTVAVIAAILICVVVATTRVLLGVHYPSDVIAGLAVGVVCTALVMPVLRR